MRGTWHRQRRKAALPWICGGNCQPLTQAVPFNGQRFGHWLAWHTQGRIAEATEWARPLFERTQQRVPEALTAAVMRAIEASDAGESEVAPACLEEAIELAQDLGYL